MRDIENIDGPLVCPSCGTQLPRTHTDQDTAPVAPSVRVWMTEQSWDEPRLTRDVYAEYLVEYADEAVDRARFVRDLRRFGVQEETDAGGRRVLICP
ncbi:hypothetical protein [Blastococcus sp. SYSU DS0616]